MIAGLPGNMASLVAEYVHEAADMELLLCGLAEEDGTFLLEGDEATQTIMLSRPGRCRGTIERAKPDVVVDFTMPAAVNQNAWHYCECGIPFVMGTTGGDREALVSCVAASSISAVVAPNMAKQIVAFQAMMTYAAEHFPGVFEGYQLDVSESHQAGKKDTSGTAKAVVQCFNAMGIPFKERQIRSCRNALAQEINMRIPEAYLAGHAWHTYSLKSADGTVFFQFTHNVNGRNVYAEGTLDAIRFLATKKGVSGKVFSMIDVLSDEKSPA